MIDTIEKRSSKRFVLSDSPSRRRNTVMDAHVPGVTGAW